MGMGFSEKDININTGGSGHGYGYDGGGMPFGGGLGGLLFGLLLGGRGGLFGGNCGNGYGNAGATAASFEALALDNIKTAVSTSTGAIVNSVDKNTASLAGALAEGFASQNLARSEQSANLTSQFTNTNTLTQAGITRLENFSQAQNTLIGTGFASQKESFAALALQNCQDKGEVLSAINCSTNSINGNLNTGFSAIAGQNAQIFNHITALGCSMDRQFVETNCNIKTSKQEIVARIEKSEADARHAADQARIRELEQKDERRTHNDTIVNVNNNVNNNINSIQNQLTTLVSVVARMAGNGGGNGNNGNGNNGNGNSK